MINIKPQAKLATSVARNIPKERAPHPQWVLKYRTSTDIVQQSPQAVLIQRSTVIYDVQGDEAPEFDPPGEQPMGHNEHPARLLWKHFFQQHQNQHPIQPAQLRENNTGGHGLEPKEPNYICLLYSVNINGLSIDCEGAKYGKFCQVLDEI